MTASTPIADMRRALEAQIASLSAQLGESAAEEPAAPAPAEQTFAEWAGVPEQAPNPNDAEDCAILTRASASTPWQLCALSPSRATALREAHWIQLEERAYGQPLFEARATRWADWEANCPERALVAARGFDFGANAFSPAQAKLAPARRDATDYSARSGPASKQVARAQQRRERVLRQLARVAEREAELSA